MTFFNTVTHGATAKLHIKQRLPSVNVRLKFLYEMIFLVLLVSIRYLLKLLSNA